MNTEACDNTIMFDPNKEASAEYSTHTGTTFMQQLMSADSEITNPYFCYYRHWTKKFESIFQFILILTKFTDYYRAF